MSDTFGEIFAILLCVVLMGVCPVVLTNMRHESNAAYIAMGIASSFEEELVQNGYVSWESYKEVSERLAILGGYELSVQHEKRLSEGYSEDGLYTEVAKGYAVTDTAEIEAVLADGHIYPMYIGDRVRVKVKKGRYEFEFGGLVFNEAY